MYHPLYDGATVTDPPVNLNPTHEHTSATELRRPTRAKERARLSRRWSLRGGLCSDTRCQGWMQFAGSVLSVAMSASAPWTPPSQAAVLWDVDGTLVESTKL